MAKRRNHLLGRIAANTPLARRARRLRYSATERAAAPVRARGPRQTLIEFFQGAWPQLESRPLVWSEHLDELCRILTLFCANELRNEDGRVVRRLAINIAPGTTKSLLCSVIYPTWQMAMDPRLQIITGSNALSLAVRDSLKSNELVQSEWFQERWGHELVIAKRQDTKQHWGTTAGGFRYATSTGSKFTGWRGDEIVLDDILDADARHSRTKRDAALKWLIEKMTTRLNDEQTGRLLVVGQRLHAQDPFGRKPDDDIEHGGLQHRPDWDHLIIERKKLGTAHPSNTIEWRDTRSVGHFLVPERFTTDEWAKRLTDLGTRGRNAQEQQRPSESDGGIWKRHWWNYYEEASGNYDAIVATWDATFGAQGERASFVVGSVYGITMTPGHERAELLDQYRRRSGFPDTWRAIKGMKEKWRTDADLIENKANGSACIQFLRRNGTPVVSIEANSSKMSRGSAATPFIERGSIWLPADNVTTILGRQPWREGDFGESISEDGTPETFDPQVVVEEGASFPGGDTNDAFDALTQLIDWAWLTSNQTRIGPSVR